MISVAQQLHHLYQMKGQERYGEGVDQVSHALSCAFLAKKRNANNKLIIAAFFHDVGHLLDSNKPRMWSIDGVDLGDTEHDRRGADFLRSLGFDTQVTDPILYHVQAKRYLCKMSRSYLDRLSTASRATLELQGGVMSDAEQKQFRALPCLKDALLIRYCDDNAKNKTYCLSDCNWVFQLVEEQIPSIQDKLVDHAQSL